MKKITIALFTAILFAGTGAVAQNDTSKKQKKNKKGAMKDMDTIGRHWQGDNKNPLADTMNRSIHKPDSANKW
ncbi:MAG: hypothetical protein WC716_07730 [Chitinophagaceae bacterium]|jgi:hypothetical protein